MNDAEPPLIRLMIKLPVNGVSGLWRMRHVVYLSSLIVRMIMNVPQGSRRGDAQRKLG
jgi:hypothetical protein